MDLVRAAELEELWLGRLHKDLVLVSRKRHSVEGVLLEDHSFLVDVVEKRNLSN